VTTPPNGSAVDVIDLILADHRRIRRLAEALSEAARHAGEPRLHWMLSDLWQRLADLLEAHFAAEEEICGPAMFGVGKCAAGQLDEVIADHNDIREAVLEACLYPVGSALWWRTAGAALATSAIHLDREESGLLTDCQRVWSDGQRGSLGRQWVAFTSARRRARPTAAAPQPAADRWAARARPRSCSMAHRSRPAPTAKG
jgi:Hemerythrin HHE cation binding domain